MLDLSVDESYVIVKDGPRGQQFCVVVDRLGDEDHPLLPYPALGSTERAIIRPAPDGERTGGLPGHRRRPAPPPARRDPARPGRLAGDSGVLAPREDAELEGLDADDAGHLLLLVWNTAGGGSEVDAAGHPNRRHAYAAGPRRVVTGALLSRDGSTAVMSVEGPLRPRELRSLDTATLVWTRVTDGPELPPAGLVRPTLASSSRAGTGCR